MIPNKQQVYGIITVLDLCGVGPTKGVNKEFAHMMQRMLEDTITYYGAQAFLPFTFGKNGPAGPAPAYPEKTTTWKTLLRHGKEMLDISDELYIRIGAEYNLLSETRKNPNGYTDSGKFQHSTTKSAISKGLNDANNMAFMLLRQLFEIGPQAFKESITNIATQVENSSVTPHEVKPKKVVAPIINEALMARSLPSSQPTDVLLPKNTYGKDMPIPPNHKNAIRKLKQRGWAKDKVYTISSYGASVFIQMFSEPDADKYYQLPDDLSEPQNLSSARTPNIIVKFTVGQKPVFSTFVGDTATTYPFGNNNITEIHITWSNPEDGPVYATSCRIWAGHNDATPIEIKGMDITGIKKMKEINLNIKQPDEHTIPECLEFGLLPYGDGVEGSGLNEEDDNFLENLKKLCDDGCGVYHFKPQAKLYASPDMYIPDKAKEEEYLLPPEVDFKSITAIGNDESIAFDLHIENPTFSTDNYTGRDSSNPRSELVERLMFPGDESLLAPLGFTNNGDDAECGKTLPEGRVLKSIKVAETGGAIFKIKMEFRDGSTCIFPDAETKVFSAVDKETGQLLKGTVEMQSLGLNVGDVKSNYAELLATRRSRNLNQEHNAIIGDDNLTAAIAWYGGKQGETLKILVPDPNNEGKSVIITIPLMEA